MEKEKYTAYDLEEEMAPDPTKVVKPQTKERMKKSENNKTNDGNECGECDENSACGKDADNSDSNGDGADNENGESESAEIQEGRGGDESGGGSDGGDDTGHGGEGRDGREGREVECRGEIERMIREMGAGKLLEIIHGNRNAAIGQILEEMDAQPSGMLQSGTSAAGQGHSIFDLASLA